MPSRNLRLLSMISFATLAIRGGGRIIASAFLTTPIARESNVKRSIIPFVLRQRSFSQNFQHIYVSMEEDLEAEVQQSEKTTDSKFDVAVLKKETQRLVFRSHKRIGKASERLRKATEQVEKLTADENASMEELENCPNLNALEKDLEDLQTRLAKLNELEDKLANEKKGKRVLPPEIAELAIQLEVSDSPPKPQPRGPKKKKGPRSAESMRLPYRRYYSKGGVEIRVGKQAEDNDQLSCSPEYRDGADWWMHASGCPGSHVVIRCHDNQLDPELVQDAAALAARQSKCQGSTIKVSLTRCRDVKKPPGAKAGLVQLTGTVKTVAVKMSEAEQRFKRLDETCLVN